MMVPWSLCFFCNCTKCAFAGSLFCYMIDQQSKELVFSKCDSLFCHLMCVRFTGS